MVCSICYDQFTSPVSLPCGQDWTSPCLPESKFNVMELGHIFCRDCIRRSVDAIQVCAVQHSCPTCRTAFNIVTVDLALVPAYLRPHILPTIRPVFFDDTPSALSSNSVAKPKEDKESEEDVEHLRYACRTWHRRAEMHASANAGLIGFARAAKEYALCMRAERDEALERCVALEHKLSALMSVMETDTLAPQWERSEEPALPVLEPPGPEISFNGANTPRDGSVLPNTTRSSAEIAPPVDAPPLSGSISIPFYIPSL
ncbi:hypothetical protein C8R46DRAFT_1028230 [Mycena filopes]|nr:hypothetical protein C8R46DRAFT_1028230 [Mycena filopes]